jgi:4'-phosphopantetheinyl transferase
MAEINATYPDLFSWIISLNRPPTEEEYNLCLRCLDSVSRDKIMKIQDRDAAWRSLLGRLVVHVIMRQRQIPRDSWSIATTKYGKPYILGPNDDRSMGYNISHDGSLVAFAFALGPRNKVWNIGVDVRRVTSPKGVSLSDFVESLVHKLTNLEMSFVAPELGEDVILRRLYILWTLKEAYTKALGQPLGFDFSRIECNIPDETITVDGVRLVGWEFRLFKANVGVAGSDGRLGETEIYQCVCAIYRGGGMETKFVWSEKPRELDKWLRFVTIESMVGAATSMASTYSR